MARECNEYHFACSFFDDDDLKTTLQPVQSMISRFFAPKPAAAAPQQIEPASGDAKACEEKKDGSVCRF